MGDNAMVVAWIGAGASLLGALGAWLSTRNIEKRKGEIAADVGKKLEATKAELAKDLAANESALRVTAERQLSVFKLAAASAEEASRALHDWQAEARRFFAATQQSELSTHTGEAWKVRLEFDLAAEKAGLFLPPELDEPYTGARTAQRAAIDAIMTFANSSGSDMAQDRADCRGRMAAASAALEEFVSQVRTWKAREWGAARGGAAAGSK